MYYGETSRRAPSSHELAYGSTENEIRHFSRSSGSFNSWHEEWKRVHHIDTRPENPDLQTPEERMRGYPDPERYLRDKAKEELDKTLNELKSKEEDLLMQREAKQEEILNKGVTIFSIITGFVIVAFIFCKMLNV